MYVDLFFSHIQTKTGSLHTYCSLPCFSSYHDIGDLPALLFLLSDLTVLPSSIPSPGKSLQTPLSGPGDMTKAPSFHQDAALKA